MLRFSLIGLSPKGESFTECKRTLRPLSSHVANWLIHHIFKMFSIRECGKSIRFQQHNNLSKSRETTARHVHICTNILALCQGQPRVRLSLQLLRHLVISTFVSKNRAQFPLFACFDLTLAPSFTFDIGTSGFKSGNRLSFITYAVELKLVCFYWKSDSLLQSVPFRFHCLAL